MPDPRFYEDLGPVSIEELVAITGATRSGPAADGRTFTSVAPLDRADQSAVSFFSDSRYVAALKTSGAGVCFVSAGQVDLAPSTCVGLITPKPKIAYAKAAARLHRPWAIIVGDERIHRAATLEDGVELAPGAIVGPGARIGEGTHLGANAVIGPGVTVGRDCVIGANVTIGFALIGDRVRILAGAVIGEAGFGVDIGPEGAIDVPQLGRVILQDGVTVGANTCIDRGAWEDTVVGENTKIDNQVQIGHNVQLGRSCVLCGQVGLSGSTIVGDGVMFGAKAGVADHVKIGAGARVMPAAGVMRDIPAGETWAAPRPSEHGNSGVRSLGSTVWKTRTAAEGRGLSEAILDAATQVDIGIDEILQLIPHRPPFLMIDRAEDFQAYKSLVGVKCIANNEPFFAGHFPGFPVMPGVMIIEAIAQTGGVLMSKSMELDIARKTILFMSLDNCRFRYPVRPGDVLRMPVDVVRARPEVARFKGRALVGDNLAAECEFMAMVVERT